MMPKPSVDRKQQNKIGHAFWMGSMVWYLSLSLSPILLSITAIMAIYELAYLEGGR